MCPDLRHSIRWAPVECYQDVRLSGFDLVDDGHEQRFACPEVVQEHAMTGPDIRGDVAERSVSHARAPRHRVDHGSE